MTSWKSSTTNRPHVSGLDRGKLYSEPSPALMEDTYGRIGGTRETTLL